MMGVRHRLEGCEPLSYVDLVAELRWILPYDEPGHVAARLGTTTEALAMRLRRGGDRDLAEIFNSIDAKARRQRAGTRRTREAAA